MIFNYRLFFFVKFSAMGSLIFNLEFSSPSHFKCFDQPCRSKGPMKYLYSIKASNGIITSAFQYVYLSHVILIAREGSQLPSSLMLPDRQTASPKLVVYYLVNRQEMGYFDDSISVANISIIAYYLQIIMNRTLTQSTRMAQQGKISQGISALQKQLDRDGENYSVLNNLAALYLQLGDVEKSIQLSSKAISIDPFAYVAYYNRFLCFFVQEKLTLACGDLEKALSCLYLLKGYEDNNIKFLNKAINYCEQNARAYLVRAKLNEGKNNKLAENDYSIAIEYAPNLGEIYQQRALFYRRIGRTKEYQENFANYINLKEMGARHTTELIQNQQNDDINYRDKILQEVKEFQKLLVTNKAKEDVNAINQETISKLPLDSVQSTLQKKDEEQLLLSDRPDVDTAKTIQIRKEQINFRKRGFDERLNKNFEQIFQDENSKELNEEIQKLQNEIKAQGGKLSLQQNQQLDVSDPSNFLTVQIEKAIEEITKLSNREGINDVKSVRSANSNTSAKSRQSDNKQLTIDEFRSFQRMEIEIISLEDLDGPTRKEISKIVLRYRDQQYETSMNKFEWREKFIIPLEADSFELQVQAIQKGGVFRASATIGEGSINLLETSQSKCILGSKDKKTAILYYKLQLF